ncbi:MAG: HAD family hydrolase [Fimbriimonadales bacterium]
MPSPLDSIVFDLDGTLWNATIPTADAWNALLTEEGIAWGKVTPEDVASVTGMPHDAAVRKAFPGLDEASLQTLIRRSEVEDVRWIANHGAPLYPGVAAGLKALQDRYRLFIVSNCQSGYIETFFATSGLQSCFTDWECYGNTGMSKGENLRSVISRNGLQAPVMVGDTAGDEEAARSNNVPFAFVGYGFGSCTKADFRFAEFGELVRAFCP